MYDRVTFQREARQVMRVGVPHFMLVALVYYLLTNGLSLASHFLSVDSSGRPTVYLLSLFLSCLLALFSIVMAFGFCNYSLRLVRREPAGIGSLFFGFSMAGRVIGLRLMVVLFMVLWAMLFVAGLVACQMVVLMIVNSVTLYVIVIVIAYLAMFLGLYAVLLRYAMVEFALLDYPNDGIMTAIRRSKGMMKGWTAKLFRLMLPFLGWLLLVYVLICAIVAAGLYIGERDWLLEFYNVINTLEYPVDSATIVRLADALTQKIFPYELIAVAVTLPLQLWRVTYATCALARFYNYVGGYDYLQYMRAQQMPAQRPQSQPLPRPEAPAANSGAYYIPPSMPERNQEDQPAVPTVPIEETSAPSEELPAEKSPAEEEANSDEDETEEI